MPTNIPFPQGRTDNPENEQTEHDVAEGRVAGTFLTEADLKALPPQKRVHGHIAMTLDGPKMWAFDIDSAATPSATVLAPDAGSGRWKQAGSSGGAPTGTAGGDLGGTYPDPAVFQAHLTNQAAPAAPAAGSVILASFDQQGFPVPHIYDPQGNAIEITRDALVVVRNNSGVSLPKGTAVYVNGSTGTVSTVAKAKADSTATLPCFGVMYEDTAHATYGRMMLMGEIENFDLSAFANGDTLYLSQTTAGALTNVVPTTGYVQMIGTVISNFALGTLAVLVRTVRGSGATPAAPAVSGAAGVGSYPSRDDHVHPQPTAAQLITDVGTVVARVRTTVALAAYTYANGSSGVGATITANANGALAAIDGVTLSAGDVLLVQNGAAFADNGLYTVTQIGDAGTPFILTRSIACDTQTKILAATIKIREGNSCRGAIYEYCGAAAITIGTTALSWIRADNSHTPNEYVALGTDFEEQTTPLTGNSVMAGMWPGFVTLVGTASVAPRTVADGTERGVLRLSASTTTGSASLTFSVGGFPIMVTTDQYFELEVVVFGPNALSDGTDTFRMMAGLSQAVGVGGTDGVWCEYTQATSTSWLAVTRTGSASSTQAGPTVQVNTKVRMKLIKRPGETAFEVYFNGAQYTSLSAHQPLSVPLTPNITLTKSAGNVNARSFDIDFWRVVQAWPNRRAA